MTTEELKAWAGNSQWRRWRADYARFRRAGLTGWGTEGFWALTVYRAGRAVLLSRHRRLLLPVWIVLRIARKFVTICTHIDLPPGADIGPGTLIQHIGFLHVHAEAKVGAYCALHHLITIGAAAGKTMTGAARVGDDVMIGSHTVIIGGVVIGNGAMIAAGSVVMNDIPPWTTAAGVPARAIAVRSRPPGHENDEIGWKEEVARHKAIFQKPQPEPVGAAS